jgi:hypothetical protein
MASWWTGPSRDYEDTVESFFLRVAFVGAIFLLALLMAYLAQ